MDEIGDAAATLASPEKYFSTDSLVHYVDPKKHGFQTIDSLNRRPYIADSLPMFRIMAGRYGMTFTDPQDHLATFYYMGDRDVLLLANPLAQLDGDGNVSTRYVNAVTSIVMGFAGIPMLTTGSNIVPATSSDAQNVDMLNDEMVDVARKYFNAAPEASRELGKLLGISFAVVQQEMKGIDNSLGLISSEMADAVKAVLAVQLAALLAGTIVDVVQAGIADLSESHNLPIDKGFKNWILNNSVHVYEDFLYERPFVNLALNDTATLNQLQGMSDSARDVSTLNRNCFYIGSGDTAKDAVVKKATSCAVGLFKSANDLNSTQKKQPLSGLTMPLRFKSESDWSKMGVKVDRWEKVDGLHPDGSLNEKGVPIRHVERYEVPAITVDDWIEKYSFVVDDLMPHRLRQIRINFNYQEEIAWECDVKKDSDANDACTVYKRSGGGSWDNPIIIVDSADVNGNRVETRRDTIDKVPHPVKKNGQFDFIATDFYPNLLAIQKDNQNTVTISTVNKIGLSNTQRFYYLFKATANMLQPSWPKRDVVVNKIKGFKAYASALGYQGFKADSAKDEIRYLSLDSARVLERLVMNREVQWYVDSSLIASGASETGIVYDSSSAYFASNHADENPHEGEYLWKFFVDIKNIADTASKDSSNTYEVPFTVDRTPPAFVLRSEGVVNPDSASFAARFSWADSTHAPDIRAMRVSLGRLDGKSLDHCKLFADFPAMANIASKEFAIQWNSVTRNAVKDNGDGNYCVKAYAVDYAVPDSAVYKKMVDLVDAISAHSGSIADSLWPDSNDFVNSSIVFDSFFVDTRAPVMSDGAMRGSSTSASAYSALSRPARNSAFGYVSEDSLLEISYKVTEPLGGRDSVPVTVSWNFVHLGDTTRVDHAGDSVWVKNGDAVNSSWTEMSICVWKMAITKFGRTSAMLPVMSPVMVLSRNCESTRPRRTSRAW